MATAREQSVRDYRPRVERALALIARRLDDPPSVAEVAKVAHLSEHHFHRIFSAIVGEPIGRYVTRKRLEVAALRLAYEPRRSVTDIALSVGYSSVSNFSKAFSAHFGCAPSRARRAGAPAPIAALTRAHARGFDPEALYSLPPQTPEAEARRRYRALAENIRYAECPGIDVACLASPMGYDLPALMATWEELIDRARQLGIAEGEVDAYGMAHDSPRLVAQELCRYHACVPCPIDVPLPPPLFRGRIPAGRYAIYRYRGPVSGVEDAYRDLYSIWLPRSSLVPGDYVAIEHYDHDEPRDGHTDHEIWIAVQPDREPA